jgi:hypothetical protein
MIDLSGTILKLIVGIFIGAVLFYLFDLVKNEHVLIVVTDSTNCEVIDYSLIFDDRVISAETAQLNKSMYKDSVTYEKFFSVLAKENDDGYITYNVRVRYKDCAEIIGPLNKIRHGWVIYESVQNDKIVHDVRSK